MTTGSFDKWLTQSVGCDCFLSQSSSPQIKTSSSCGLENIFFNENYLWHYNFKSVFKWLRQWLPMELPGYYKGYSIISREIIKNLKLFHIEKLTWDIKRCFCSSFQLAFCRIDKIESHNLNLIVMFTNLQWLLNYQAWCICYAIKSPNRDSGILKYDMDTGGGFQYDCDSPNSLNIQSSLRKFFRY